MGGVVKTVKGVLGGGPKAPKVPDYQNLAVQQAKLDNPTVNTPFGSSSYTVNPDGSASYNQTLSGPQQQLFNNQQANDLKYQGAQGEALDNYNVRIGTADSARQKVEDALYSRSTAMLDPQYQQAEKSLEAKLANEGIFRGSEAFDTAMGNFSRTKDSAYADARDRAILAGGQEQSRIEGDANQYLSLIDSLYNYQYPLGDANFTPANTYGAAQDSFNANMDRRNSKVAEYQGYLNTISQLGSNALYALPFL